MIIVLLLVGPTEKRGNQLLRGSNCGRYAGEATRSCQGLFTLMITCIFISAVTFLPCMQRFTFDDPAKAEKLSCCSL